MTEEEWVALAPRLRDALLCRRLRDLVDAGAAQAAIDAALAPAVPIVAALLRELGARASGRSESVGELVGPEARAELEALAAEPDVLDEALVRTALQDPAVEAVLRDVVGDALDKFSRSANPFGGVGSLIDDLPLIARTPIKRTLETMRAGFESRLEPEIRRFLDRFAKDSLDRSVARVLKRQGEPEQVALRKRLVGVMLDRPLARVVWPPDDRRGARAHAAAVAALRHALAHEMVRAELHGALDRLLATHGDRTLGELAVELGIDLPEPAPFARAAWPLVRTLLELLAARG